MAAVSTALRAAASHDSLLTPITSVTRYTLSAMQSSFRSCQRVDLPTLSDCALRVMTGAEPARTRVMMGVLGGALWRAPMRYQRSIRGREARVPADAPRPLVAEQVWRPAMLPFALAAVAGLASVALPGPALDRSEFLIACAITAGMLVVGLLVHLRHRDRWLIGILPLGYLVVAALLRHASAGSVEWLPSRSCSCPRSGWASSAPGASCWSAWGRLAPTLLVPCAVFGEPRYPPSTLRSALLVAHGGGARRPDHPAPAGAGAREPRSPVRRPGRRDREGDRRGPPSGATITVFNRGAERMLGYRADEVVGVATPGLFLDPDEIAERAAELGVEPGVTRSSSPPAARRATRRGADLRAQGRDAAPGLADADRRSADPDGPRRASSASPPTSASRCARRPR